MRVGVVARLLTEPSLRGWNRYTVNLLAELARLGDVELVLYSTGPIHPDHRARLSSEGVSERVAPPMRLPRWEHVWLPRRCARDGVDVLHAPANFGLPWSSPCPRVLTLHDAIDWVYYAPTLPVRERVSSAHLKSRFYHWLARTRAHQVITVSRHARGDIVRHLGVPAGRVHVVEEAADPHFLAPVDGQARAEVASKHGLGRRYVFYVGGWEGRKNVPFLLRGFADAALEGVDLVLAGGRDDQRGALVRRAEALGVADRVRLIGWVDEADLPALYAGALAFAYPSEYEGFGLQLCEAMATGCPVLAARATCLPEVLGPGGETFALDDPAELAALLRRVADDPAFRDDLIARGRARSAEFSWRKAAEETREVYRLAIGGDRLSSRPADSPA
jgi:glycosyltransferase involved in cell wall biosynthesis